MGGAGHNLENHALHHVTWHAPAYRSVDVVYLDAIENARKCIFVFTGRWQRLVVALGSLCGEPEVKSQLIV